jgi:transcription initiation factor TFIID subunit 2
MAAILETTPSVENSGFAMSYQRADLGFSVLHQKVLLDIDPVLRKLRGSTEITIAPHSEDLKTIRLHCRQCNIKRLTLNGRPCASLVYRDPYKRRKLNWQTDIHQYHLLQERLEGQLKVPPAEPELVVTLSKSTKIHTLPEPVALDQFLNTTNRDVNMIDTSQNAKSQIDQTTRFTPVIMYVEFTIDEIRDGLQFIGWNQGDLQYPHAFSKSSSPGTACCLYPCLDAVDSLSTWEVSITCPRTVGDAFRSSQTSGTSADDEIVSQHLEADSTPNFSVEEQALDLVVVCSGDLTDEVSGMFIPTI